MQNPFARISSLVLLFVGFIFVTSYALADAVAPQDFFAQVLQVIHDWGGIQTMAKISAAITLIIASMKVTYLNELIWQKIGALQTWVAPILGLVGGIVGLGVSGPVTLASVVAYVTAGAGAVFLHEILDTVKAIPGVGTFYLNMINTLEKTLGGPAVTQPKTAQQYRAMRAVARYK